MYTTPATARTPLVTTARTSARPHADPATSAQTPTARPRGTAEAPRRRGWRRTHLVGLFVGTSLACQDAEPPTAPAGPTAEHAPSLAEVVRGGLHTISDTQPEYLKASSVNLYWTANQGPVRVGDAIYYSSRVYRAPKTGSPGSEKVLYFEARRDSRVDFRGITYANIGGSYYGYFIACYSAPAPGSCMIKRIPLAGGTATPMATLPAWASGPLERDDRFLYWSDDAGVHRLPLPGGTISTLVSFIGRPGTRSISVTSTHVYYADGAGVRRVPKGGGTASTVVTDAGANYVFAHEANGTTTVYWTAANAAVKRRVVGSSVTFVRWAGKPGRVGTSVGFDGTRLLWTDCEGSTPSTPPGCVAWRRVGDVVTALASTRSRSHLAALEWDAGAMYFTLGRGFGLRKYVH